MGPLHQAGPEGVRRRRSSRRPRTPARRCWSSASCRAGELAEGNFLRPAIVVDPDPSLRVVTQEQFGPVIPVIPFDDDADAVRLANDTWAGLCALGLDGGHRHGQPDRRPAGVRLRLGQRPRRRAAGPARPLRRHEALGHGPRAGHRGRPRLPGHPLDRARRGRHPAGRGRALTDMLRSATVDGFSLAYDRTGSGPPVVLLHGWPGSRARLPRGRPAPGRRGRRRRPGPARVRGVRQARRRPRRGVHRRGPGPQRDRAARRARPRARRPGRLRHRQPHRPDRRPAVAGAGAGAGGDPTDARRRTAAARPGHRDGVLVPALPPARPVRAAPGRQTGTPSAPISSTSGRTGRARRTRRRTRTSTGSPTATRSRGRSPPRSAGTGRARASSSAVWPSRRRRPTTGSPSRPPCSGRRTTRCSRPPGATASTSSSPTSPSRHSPAPGTSCRSRRPTPSPPPSGRRWARTERAEPHRSGGASSSQPPEGVTTAVTGWSCTSRGSRSIRSSSNTTVTRTASGRAWTRARS